ncbi:transposase [Kribbella sp. NBC_01505]|uniref:RNA-guided endonuclease InsQ/TnpB family protein n=1 Tax=Kribbella sp. NBC_01505 TaxID=2903580 RepID=UPI00386377FE
MSRFRLYPSPEQEVVLLEHCAHARFVWNLAVEQATMTGGRRRRPGFAEHCRQLTEARQEFEWLARGSCTVQQQALKDFAVCVSAWRAGRAGRPGWRKRDRHESFRIVALRPGHVRRLTKRYGEVLVPKAGRIRFRWSRECKAAKSYRIKRDAAGRWFVAFAVIPAPMDGPGTGEVVGIDRGVVNSASLSTGEHLFCPRMTQDELRRFRRLQRRLARSVRGSNRRQRTRYALARIKAKEVNRRKDWIEKLTTDLSRRFDIIRVEDLRIKNLTRSGRGTLGNPSRQTSRKAKLNRGILTSGWGALVRRLEEKSGGRVERVSAAFTSQTCSECGYCAPENRKSQAIFECDRCGRTMHADTNAAINIAAGRVVPARGGMPTGAPSNREPRHATSLAV